MEVFVVSKEYDYDAPEIVGVYSSEGKAIEMASFKYRMSNDPYIISAIQLDTEDQRIVNYSALAVKDLPENLRCDVNNKIEDDRQRLEQLEANRLMTIREKEKQLDGSKQTLQTRFEDDLKDLDDSMIGVDGTRHTDRDKIMSYHRDVGQMRRRYIQQAESLLELWELYVDKKSLERYFPFLFI